MSNLALESLISDTCRELGTQKERMNKLLTVSDGRFGDTANQVSELVEKLKSFGLGLSDLDTIDCKLEEKREMLRYSIEISALNDMIERCEENIKENLENALDNFNCAKVQLREYDGFDSKLVKGLRDKFGHLENEIFESVKTLWNEFVVIDDSKIEIRQILIKESKKIKIERFLDLIDRVGMLDEIFKLMKTNLVQIVATIQSAKIEEIGDTEYFTLKIHNSDPESSIEETLQNIFKMYDALFHKIFNSNKKILAKFKPEELLSSFKSYIRNLSEKCVYSIDRYQYIHHNL